MEEKIENTAQPKKSGGLYSKVNISVKAANALVAGLMVLLILATVFIVSHNGFTVKFDTNGGSHIESVKAMHSQVLRDIETPVKEGYVFDGWYLDKDCTNEWDIESNPVEGSITLYAGWQSKN